MKIPGTYMICLRSLGFLFLTALLAAGESVPMRAPPPVADSAPGRYAEVTVEPTDTSVYVASVRLTMPPFTRRGGVYIADYTAKVFPFFFFNEQGTLSIEISEDQLQQLERGETVNFTGHASNRKGAARRVTGRAVSAAVGGDHGKLKVRVWVSKNIELVFNTVYRFTGKE
jgi:hypothetical protein